ncbi:MAG: type II secretion system protein GspL [Nitrospiria bacterium]
MRIIGLEFDTRRVRFAELEENWGGKLTLSDCGEFSIDSGKPPDSAFQKRVSQADQIIVSLPGHLISSRVVSLPFTQPKKIEQVLPYEVEPLFPFELDRLILTHQILSQEEASSRVLVGAVLKEDFRSFMEKLQKQGIDPHQVECDSLALFNFTRIMPPFEEESLLLLNIGEDFSSLCFIKGDIPVMLRSVAGGTKDFNDSSVWEEDHPFIKELLKTTQVFKAESGEPVQALAVCGEGGRIKDLPEWVSRQAGVPLLEWKVEPGKIKTGPAAPTIGEGIDPLFVPAVGLALKGSSLRGSLSRMNFRKEEFAHVDVEKGKKGIQRILFFSLLTLLILGFSDFGIRISIKKNHYENITRQLQNEYRTLFPGSGPILNEIDQIRGTITGLKKKEAFLNLNNMTPLEVLKELTIQIPKEVKIDVNDLSIESDKIRLEGETDSFESLDKIKTSLGKVRSFREITVTDAKMNAEESRVHFKLDITRSLGAE